MTTEEHVKHTPGPWTWRESEDTKEGTFGPLCLEDEACNMVISADLHVDALTGAMHLGISVTDAHATLIAAAPELLAEYQCLRNRVIAMRDAAYRLEHQGRNPNIGGFFREWLADDVLEGAAIAKTDGKE